MHEPKVEEGIYENYLLDRHRLIWAEDLSTSYKTTRKSNIKAKKLLLIIIIWKIR